MNQYKIVGHPIPRIDAAEKVRGRAVFTADVEVPQMLVGKYLPSPFAHAEILSIDTSRAEAIPGVAAVITARDMLLAPAYDPMQRVHAYLARRFVVFAGQPVAAVAAEDLATAEIACDLIQVQYKQLPIVNTIKDALLPEMPAVSYEPDPKQESPPPAQQMPAPNIRHLETITHGDLDKAFAESDVIVEYTYSMPQYHQGFLEPQAVIAWWDRPDHVQVWDSCQGVFDERSLISRVLNIPETEITMQPMEVGGGFGAKFDRPFAPLAVLLAQKACRPVKLVLTRQEELSGANPAPASIVRMRIGAKRDGSLKGMDATVWMDSGAFPGLMFTNIVVLLLNKYQFSAFRVEGFDVTTNKVSVGSYRAPGAVNACFPLESTIEELAHQLQIDPLEFRKKNAMLEGEILFNGRPQARVGTLEILEALQRHPAWILPMPENDSWLRGRGVALGSWGSGMFPAGVHLILEADGVFRLVTASVNLTGSSTSLCQIAAETLGVSMDRIRYNRATTDFAPYAPVSGGSCTIYSVGRAVYEAAIDLKGKAFQRASKLLEVSINELEWITDRIRITANPDRALTLDQLYRSGANIDEGFGGPLFGQGSVLPQERAPIFAATIAQVAVDPETGFVRLERLVTAQDTGTAINPLSVEGQIQGAASQSIGMALWEEVQYDQDGRVLNANLLDYRMPTSVDLPPLETLLVDVPAGDGPFGAKGVGEPPVVSPVAAVANAVSAAIGIRMTEVPITPERIWHARNEKGK